MRNLKLVQSAFWAVSCCLQGCLVSSFHVYQLHSPKVTKTKVRYDKACFHSLNARINRDQDEPLSDDEDVYISDDDFEILFGEEEKQAEHGGPLETAWRYAKKPLLSIGAKGANFSHGNSLRQLLEAHTIVKVKCNTKQFGTLEKAFEQIRDLALESGAPEGIEMLQARDKDKIILFGMPGTKDRIERGDFPPPLESSENKDG